MQQGLHMALRTQNISYLIHYRKSLLTLPTALHTMSNTQSDITMKRPRRQGLMTHAYNPSTSEG